ncbi:hypothetical protein KIW84_042291 [Lathyrus oleraceus]|uniref:PABC domain-containing protein n=1 Tax=Pisum sativum TaxID=3888 RepID=A0A9D5AMI6_PEA|nr:hypothetical protein KIW84_042291 [Pisum sativum]
MKTACSFALPHIMGWDRLTNQKPSETVSFQPNRQLGGTVGFQLKISPQILDLEWLAPLAHDMLRWQPERSYEQMSFVSRTNVRYQSKRGHNALTSTSSSARRCRREVTGMLLEMDQPEVLHLIESPDALKAKVAKAMDVLRNVSQQGNSPTDQLASHVLEFVQNGYEEPAPTEAEESSQRLEELKKKKKITDDGVLGMIQRVVSTSIFPSIMRAKTSKKA